MKKTIFSKTLIILSGLLLTKLIIYLCSNNIEFVEKIFAQKIFIKIATLLSSFFGVFPFSVGEVLLIVIILYLIIKLVVILKELSAKKLINYILNILILAVYLQLIFWSFWGINNYRYTFAELSGLEISKSNNEDLENICLYLVKQTNEIRTKIPEDELGISIVPGSYDYILDNSVLAYSNICEIYDFIPDGSFCKPKPLIASEIMCKLNYTGVFIPFTNEPNVNIKEPDFKTPFTVCHEIAHQRGFARENEANFISFLTCINSNDDIFKYSGYLSALTYCTNALYSSDKTKYNNVRSHYSEGVTRDLSYINKFWSQYEGLGSKIGEINNDNFLKSTNQPEGVKSYGMVVDLILSYYKDNNGLITNIYDN